MFTKTSRFLPGGNGSQWKLISLHHHGRGSPLDILVLVLVQGQSALGERSVEVSGQLRPILLDAGHGHIGNVALTVGVAVNSI